MDFRLYYPKWKEKALTFSYDDGQIFDRRLVEIFNKFGLRATFHLNSGMLDKESYVTREELPQLYAGHEIACHGVMHEYPAWLPQGHLVNEFYQDRLSLEQASGRIVRGCSYAFGEYNDNVVSTLKQLGFAYSRTVESTGGFGLPVDFLRWTPTCHHNDAFGELADRFLHTPEYMRLPLFYVWGHCFEFDREQTWEQMEAFCSKISGQEDVWYTTNIDYVNYVNAARSLIFSMDGTQVQNLSAIPVYAEMNGERRVLTAD